MRNTCSFWALMLGSVLSLSLPTTLRADSVNYTGLSGTLTNPFDSGGVTATGSGTLFADGTGLGVQGGIANDVVDGTESVHFTFDAGPASGVTVMSDLGDFGATGVTTFTVQGFGVGGTSLGTVTFGLGQFPNYNISSAFGNVLLSGFTWNGSGGAADSGYTVSIINYTPAPAATPEPSSLVLLGTGIVGAALSLRRRFAF